MGESRGLQIARPVRGATFLKGSQNGALRPGGLAPLAWTSRGASSSLDMFTKLVWSSVLASQLTWSFTLYDGGSVSATAMPSACAHTRGQAPHHIARVGGGPRRYDCSEIAPRSRRAAQGAAERGSSSRRDAGHLVEVEGDAARALDLPVAVDADEGLRLLVEGVLE